jgi:hypothetical protein
MPNAAQAIPASARPLAAQSIQAHHEGREPGRACTTSTATQRGSTRRKYPQISSAVTLTSKLVSS